MNVFSRRKRLLNRTPKAPKMSSRRQFHRALRRHPAWPAVMEQAAARARAQESIRRSAGVMEVGTVSHLARFRRAVRRNRVLLVTLLAVGGVLAALTGISMAQGEWQALILQESQLPPARFGAATTYDGANQATVVFGGFVGTTSASNVGTVAGPPIVTDGTTYLHKAGNSYSGIWGRRDTLHRPSPRGFASMAYDGARRNVVLFGGAPYRSNNVSGETWIWDGGDWTLVEPPGSRPDPRQNAVMVYDAHRKVVVMFGGRDKDGKPMNDTWTWNGSAWKIMPAAGAPSPRHSAAIAYDVCNAEAVMFGGIGDPVNNFVPQPGETWTWDGAKWTQWTPQGASLSPPRRIGAGMGYSYRSGGVLLYGGLYTPDAGVPTAAMDTDVWRWHRASPTGWEKLNSELTTAATIPCGAIILCGITSTWVPPAARAYASFAQLHDGSVSDDYDGGGERQSFLLFGGTPYTDLGSAPFAGPTPQVAFGDHFRFNEWNFLLLGLIYGDVGTDNPFPFDPIDNPLLRRCANPVPIPDDVPGQGVAAPEGPEFEAREGVREIGQLPVLIGTDWPAANRNTHVGSGSTLRPNPNYSPAPDCPNRYPQSSHPNGETGSNTHLVTDQKRNRVYQFFICDSDRGRNQQFQALPLVPRLLIAAYDGTTLKLLGSVVAPVTVDPSGAQTFLGDLLLHDVNGGRFLVASGGISGRNLWALQQDLIEKSSGSILEPSQVPKISLTGSISKMSFFNHPKTNRAKLLINRGGATLSQVDLESNTVDWNGTATGCAGMGGDSHSINMRPMRSGNFVYNGCSGAVNGSNRMGVVRIPITENPDGSETAGTAEAFAGPFTVTKNWGDPQAERMLLISVGPSGSAPALWVFDGKTSRFVGRAGIRSAFEFGVQYGFDQETGRLYVHAQDDKTFVAGEKFEDQGGLLLLDARLTPVPQPLKFPQFSSPPGSPPAALPAGPGVPRRVFIRVVQGAMRKYPNWETINFKNEMFYRVLADEVPLPEKTQLSQLDSLTIPVAEKPGKTEVSFDAEGSGYGIRLRSVGGLWSAVRPFPQMYSSIEIVESLFLGNARYTVPACVFPDRELVAGWVPQARLSDLDALARSSGLEVDSNSKIDLTGPFSRCNPSASASNFPPSIKFVFDVLWPLKQMVESQGNNSVGSQLIWSKHFKEVECVGDALATNTATVGNVYGSANCVQRQGLVEATARGSAPGVGPASSSASSAGFSVTEGYSTVTIAREPATRGVVVTSTAVAKGIQLPNLTIGYVETKAVAWSNGRPSEKRASFERKICQVQIPLFEQQQPYKDNACLNETQQQDLMTRWNSGWGINSKMYLPMPDPDFYKGSPGGYIAGVIKPTADEIEDQLFAKDFQREVPGLVIDFYKDSQNQGNARQSLQLAAVRAVAGLGVQCNPDLVYSPQAKDCVALAFEDDPVTEEFFEEEETEDGVFNSYDDSSEGSWTPVEALSAPEGLALGNRLGRFIENLPVLRRLPIRQMGEALLAASVWLLFLLPPLLASRRFALNLARRSQ